ncbi:peptide chain release factor 1 [Candidatus Microgenomates bacterium]|nr:peptide chain release factor 1 [Candidatus Microgenomates bacterium]
MEKEIEALKLKLKEIEAQMAEPDFVMSENYVKTSQEYAQLKKIVEAWEDLQKAEKQFAGNEQIIIANEDPELVKIATDENKKLSERIQDLGFRIQEFLSPKDPLDQKSIIMEIRPAAGGEESALFGEELLRMYSRYGESKGYSVSPIDISYSDLGGIKSATLEILGLGAYSCFKYESGVHRVQRIPATESMGRVHTSTVTVAVLPEAEEVDLRIKPEDVRLDLFRSSGPGGQNVNKTETAVRLTHLPTGLIVSCQDEKSQLKNKEKAMKVLRSRLYELEREKLAKERGDARKSQIGSGDRSEKIRTYNFPQSRVTDHRVNQSFHNLPAIMEGELDEIVSSLREAEKK